MTNVRKEKVKCVKCGAESEQLIVCSVNFSLGEEEENKKLMEYKQKCPNCSYEARDISKEDE